MTVIRFPARHTAVVWLLQASEGGWLVLHGPHGWVHGERSDAFKNASWLAANLGGVPVREVRA